MRTIFRITPGGKLTVLRCGNADCSTPIGPLVQGSDGNFYGTASVAGAKNPGTVFKITPAGKFTILHTMNGTTEGANPSAGTTPAKLQTAAIDLVFSEPENTAEGSRSNSRSKTFQLRDR